MADVPQDAIDAATDEVTRWMLEYDWLVGLTAGQVRQVSRDAVTRALEVAAPALGEHAAEMVLRHSDEHEPEPGSPQYLAWHRHFGIAASVAAGAFLAEDDPKRETSHD